MAEAAQKAPVAQERSEKYLSRREKIEQRIQNADRMIRENYPNCIIAPYPTPEGKELLFSTAFVASALGEVKRRIDRGISVEEYMEISQTIKEAEKSMLGVCKKILDSGYRPNNKAAIDKYVIDRVKEVVTEEPAPAKKSAKS